MTTEQKITKRAATADPKFVSLDDLFTKRLFHIPPYQRFYSWESKQRKALFDDINTSYEGNAVHFMSTVVVTHTDTKTIATIQHNRVAIVDGQQRIVTLAILYKALSKKLEGTSGEAHAAHLNLCSTLVKADNTTLLLEINHDPSSYVKSYLRHGNSSFTPKTVADQNIKNAIQECEKFVDKWQDDPLKLVTHIRNNLKFVYYEMADDSLAYSAFEALNSRGLPVPRLDSVKSMLIGKMFANKCAEHHMDEFRGSWSKVYESMGSAVGLGSSILRYAATLRELSKGRPHSEAYSANRLVGDVNNCGDIIERSNWIRDVTSSMANTYRNDRSSGVIKNPAKYVGVAIDLNPNFEPADKSELQNHLRNIAFCMYGICKTDSRKKVGEYMRLAHAINTTSISPDEIKNNLTAIIKDYPVVEDINALVKSDCYTGWQMNLRYLLYRYELHLEDEDPHVVEMPERVARTFRNIFGASPAQSIEHILPKKSGKLYVHWLGNMFLLPPKTNSTLIDLPPKEKQPYYEKTGFLMTDKIVDSLSSWEESEIVQRGENIAEWMKDEWGSLVAA